MNTSGYSYLFFHRIWIINDITQFQFLFLVFVRSFVEVVAVVFLSISPRRLLIVFIFFFDLNECYAPFNRTGMILNGTKIRPMCVCVCDVLMKFNVDMLLEL